MRTILVFSCLTCVTVYSVGCDEDNNNDNDNSNVGDTSAAIQLGPRPFYLVENMDEGTLKTQLLSCAEGPFQKSDFSIGHRGAPLAFPEHTEESYRAAAKMGAGIQECDVTFTKDRELVCRHSQCDLHTTTNILAIPELIDRIQEMMEELRDLRATDSDDRSLLQTHTYPPALIFVDPKPEGIERSESPIITLGIKASDNVLKDAQGGPAHDSA